MKTIKKILIGILLSPLCIICGVWFIFMALISGTVSAALILLYIFGFDYEIGFRYDDLFEIGWKPFEWLVMFQMWLNGEVNG